MTSTTSSGARSPSQEIIDQICTRVENIERDAPLKIGIDGVDGAGKTTFATALANALKFSGHDVARSSTDNFHRPKHERYRLGSDSPAGFYNDSFDYDQIQKYVLNPLSNSGTRRCRFSAYDHSTDSELLTPEVTVSENSILVFDGIFLMRPELRNYWDLSIFLRVSFEENLARTIRRDFENNRMETTTIEEFTARHESRYVGGQRMYLDEVKPESRVDIVIDNENPESPFIVSI